MKYMLLFCGTAAEDEAWWRMSPEAKDEGYKQVGAWFEKYGPKLGDGCQLQPASTATTVRRDAGRNPVVTDGPFAESGEAVGGYTIMSAADLDEVLAAAKSWPGGAVEIRPVVER